MFGLVATSLLLYLIGGLPYSEAETQKCPFQNCTAFYYSTVRQANVSFHFAWSFAGYPTLLMFYSNGASRDNDCSCSDGITVSDSYATDQNYGSVNISDAARNVALAVIFKQLIEIEVDNNAAPGGKSFNFSTGVNDAYNWVPLNTSLSDLTFQDGTKVDVTYSNSLFIENKIGTSSAAGYLPFFPRTHYTENSTTFDLAVQQFPYKSKNSRIVLETYVVTGSALEAASGPDVAHSIDDEYTPSVFDVYTYPFGNSYLQWKPISYQTAGRQSTSSQQAICLAYPGLQPADGGQLPRSLASAVFGNGANVTRFYVTIGTAGDATYLSTPYFTWTAVVGYGSRPTEHFSTTAIVILCVGFGLPMVTVLLGSLYVVYKKRPWMLVYHLAVKMKPSSFVPIVNNTAEK